MKKPTFSKINFKSLFLLLNCIKSTFILGCSIFKEILLINNDGYFLSFCDSKKLKKTVLIPVFFILSIYAGYSQVGKAFAPRLPGGYMRTKGDVIFVGNSMMSRTTTQPTFSAADPNGTPTNLATLTTEANQNYNTVSNNNGLNQEYTDIDADPTTFASSSAELKINNSCKRVVYAGLYWTAIYPYERSTDANSNTKGTPRLNDWNQIKFKVPGAANYTTLVADNAADPVGDEDDIIFDGYKAPPAASFTNSPYVCYKNVTSMLQLLTDPNGNYFAANIRAAKGKKSSGSMAGWTLVIVYESPTLPSRYISTFDGFAGITSALKNLDFTVNGFKALPAPLPVRATIGVAAQEGEAKLFGDDLLIKANSVAAFTFVNNSLNPLNNVFNSSITVPSATTPFSVNVGTRVPNSLNTLGFDMDLLNVNNPGNKVIPNAETGATYRLTSTSDTYAVYATTFAVDVIEPEIVLTKIVKNTAGVNIGNSNVGLGDYLNYEIGFKNVGNDDASSFTIKDILPVNILFDPNNIVVPSGSGVTYTYTPATRTIIFTIPNNLVKINGNQWIIKFGVQVVPNCNDLSDACSDQIKNQAFGTYKGVTNPAVITDDPSISVFGNCNLATPSATNFLVGVAGCKYTRKYQLCGKNVIISAANGYDKYSWSTSPSGSPVIGTTQSITVTNVGTYYVHNTALAPCVSIDETVTVEAFGSTTVNPVIPFADEVVYCTNNSKPLPNIYLCGDNAKRYIRTGITDTNSIIWEKSSCALVSGTKCADETTACTWTQVATGPDFNVGGQGQYRVTLNYVNGCFSRYFFNVYENKLNPTVTSRDIICNTNGEIVVGTPAAGSGYEYSLDGTTYQPSNILPISTANIYTVYIRSTVNVANRCVFTIPGIQIRKRDFTVTTTANDPLCYGGKGSVKLAANDVRAQYYFSISKGGTLVNSVGPLLTNDHTFSNLDPGAYDVKVTTDDGCLYSGTVTLAEPAKLTATADITKALTCESGEITVTPVGGTGPFTYFVNSTTDFQGSPIISITTAGTYSIKVVDFNNCEFTIADITIADNPKPVYAPTGTNVKCYGSSTGEIKFNVTNDNGYALAYSIDGTTYSSNATFSNLPAGTYTAMLKYSLGGVDCFDGPQTIIITEPAQALTASAGVSELAGCGPAKEGKIRITNPQGGNAPYEYSFDNQATWTPINDAYKAPGTYTVYVKDANGCVFAMPGVIIDPEPVAPTINVNTPVDFNCDGTATSKVIINNPGSASYSYEYYLDNVKNLNNPSNEFLNVAPGSHAVRVEYKLTSVPTYSNLLNEDFGKGTPTTTSGIASAYCFNDQHVLAPYFCPNPTRSVEDNQYSVASFFWRSDDPSSTNVGAWYHFKDHTVFTPAVTDGRYLLVNIGSAAGNYGVLYSKSIVDVIPNQPVKVDLYLGNLLRNTISAVNPDFIIELVNGSGTVVASQATGVIPNNELWNLKSLSLNPGANTSLTFKIRSGSIAYGGNDAVIDDIKVYQLPKSCITTKDFTIVVPTGKAFTAQISGSTNVTCAGANNGSITIAAQNFDAAGFQYSIDNGGTWTTTTTTPVTIPNLGAATYNVIIKPKTASVVACTKSFAPVISAPATLTINASITKTATCTTGATITAVGGGGTPAYQYELRQGVTVIKAFNTNADFTNVVPGNYTVFVRDANLCATLVGKAITVNAAPGLAATLNATTDWCYTPSNPATLVVNVTGGVAPFAYSLDGQASQNTNSFTNVAPGTHNILVTDSNNCTATISNISIAPELKAIPLVSKTLSCSAPMNATIDVTITDGNAPYTYKVKLNVGGTYSTSSNVTGNAFTYSAATAGTYYFEITDAKGCIANTSAVINAITNPTASATPTNPSCHDGTDGQVQIVPAGGSGGFTYSFNGGFFTGISLYTSLDAKTTTATTTDYTYQVKDSKGCVSPVYTVTLTNPTKVVASANIPVNSTCSTTTVVTASGAGGAGGYSFSFNGSATYTATNTLTVTNTAAIQNITYSVKDSKGCIDTKIIAIPAYNPPTGINFSVPATITCTATTTSLTLTPVAGVAPFRYTIVSGPTINTTGVSSGTFTGLSPGNYTFEVKDANGCTKQASTTIDPAATIAVSGVKTDEKCFGAVDGTVTFTVTGASSLGNYNYTLSPNAGTITKTGNVVTVTGLGANTYTFKVTDITTGCSSNTASVIVSAATKISYTVSGTNTNCNTTVSTLTFTAITGGAPGYTYAYAKSPSAVPSTVYGTSTTVDTAVLTSSIDVYVKDINGCIEKKTITIGAEATPTINTPATQCYTGTPISVTITGTYTGTPSFSIDGITYQSSPTFSLTPGSYTLYLKDGFGCPKSTPYVVAQQLTLTAVAAADVTCTPNTTINLTAAGGTGAYTYAVSLNGGAYTAASNPYVTATAGTYRFRVTDAATPACQAFSTDIVVVTKATVLTLSTTQVNVKCKGDNTGSITITPTSGKAPYTYSKDGGTAYVASNVFTNLTAGTYNIMIKDALGCTAASTPVTILDPAIALSATADAPATTTCSSSTTVTVTGHDGTPGYTYSFNKGAFTPTNTYVVNDNGIDQIIDYQVKDANGCVTVLQKITVKKLDPPTDLAFTPSGAITCSAVTTTITLGQTGGVGTLQYETIAPSPIIRAKQTSNSFAGLTSGTYIFKVTDANGCSYEESYKIDPVIPINISGQNISNVLCNGGNTGIAKYTVTGFSATGNYAVLVTSVPAVLPFAQTTLADVITLSNLTVGTYNVKVTDNTTGCTANTDVIITEPMTPLSATVFSNVNANCNIATSIVTVTPTGGTAGYLYSFVQDGAGAGTYTSSNTANLNPVTNLNWDVWVKDANSCTYKLDVAITKDPIPTVTATVTNQCSASGSTFRIKAVGASGVAPYTYTINTGLLPSPADTFAVAPGTYTITVKDANGCTNTTSITVNDVLTATAVLTKDLDCTGSPDAKITINATGGKVAYTYRVSSDGGATYSSAGFVGNVFTTAVPGTFQFEVTDSNIPACVKITNSITISPIVYPVITALTKTQSILCNGDATGIIEVTIDSSKGIGPFTYSKDGVTYQSSNSFSELVAGTYTITVKDSKGCTNTVPATLTITQNAPIVITHHEIPITCGAGGVSKGSVIIDSVTGGVGPYNYFVTGSNGYSASELNNIGNTSVTFNVVDFGLYQINVVDANGCSKLIQNVLVASPPNDLNIVINATATCAAGGKADINLAGSLTGAGPFYFAIYTGPGMVYPTGTWLPEDSLGSKHAQFTNLIPGVIYTFVVYDSVSKCYYFESAVTAVPTSSTLGITNVVPKNISCTGSADGKVSFDITNSYGVATSIIYQLYDAYTLAPKGASVSVTIPTGTTPITNFGALAVGSYFVLIKEDVGATNAGCSVVTSNFNITQSAFLLNITASVTKNENCNNLGIITALAKDGTPAYTYQISTIVPSSPAVAGSPSDSSAASWASASSSSTFNVAAGSYYVYVKDAYGCVQASSLVGLTKDPTPVIDLTVVDKCADEGSFAINVTLPTSGIAPYTIVVNGGASQNVASFPYSITGLSSGLQTITVKDVNGCSNTQTVTLNKKVSVNAVLTKEIDCKVSAAAVITLNVADGLFTNADATPDFTYEVSINGAAYGPIVNFPNDSRTTTYSVSAAGKYKFRITDLNSCQVESTVVTVDPKVDPTATDTFTNPSCPTVHDGTLTIKATLGVLPYEYSIDAGGSWQTSNIFTGLGAGVVNYVVRDFKECVFNGSETLVDPVLLNATAAVTDFACNASNIPQPAIVTVNVTTGTGTGPYKYNFDGSATYLDSNTFVVGNLAGQTVNYSVKDFNGCIFNSSTTVNAYKPLTDITFSGTAPTCPVPTSDVTLTVVGGYKPIAKYEIVSPLALNNGVLNIFSTLAPDTYLFKITDANGCTFQKSYTVKAVTPIAIVGALVNDISCNSANGMTNNGSAQYTVTGFSSTGNYAVVVTPAVLPAQITNVGDVISLTGLSAGTYNVKVTDNTTSCTQNADVTITLPAAIAFTATASKVFCSKADSQITVSGVAGGTGVYTYAYMKTGVAPVLADYSNNTIGTVDTAINGLTYDVYVKDAKDCVAMKIVTVVKDALPTITLPASQCFAGTALTVDLSVLTTTYNGVKNYTVDGSVLASSIVTFNGPGSYVLGIKDANGCEAFVTYTIEKQLLAIATLTKDLYCATPINATIGVTITDGVAPYTYQMYLGGVATGVSTPVIGSSFTASVPTAGSYYFVISDSNAAICSVTTNTVDVTTPATPTFTTTQTNVTCTGGNNGSITITPANGVTPYTFALSGVGTNNTGDANGIYTGLKAGSYTMVVSDAKGCTSAVATAIVITEPVVLTATAAYLVNTTCSVATVITVVGHDGTPTVTGTGYYYSFDNGVTYDTSNNLTVNDNGTIQTIWYSVKDANGCTTAPQSIVINPLNKPTDLSFALTTAPTCPAPTATVTLTATNGVGVLTYTILPVVPAGVVQTGNQFAGLTPGDYTFQVTDANGCTYKELYTVKAVVKIAVTGQLIANMTCNTGDDGKVTFDVSDFSVDYNYTITKDGAGFIASTTSTATRIPLTGLAYGVYKIDVSDNTTLCTSTATISVLQPTVITYTSVSTTNVNCNNTTSAITFVGLAGGTGTLTYAIVPAGTVPNPAFTAYNSNLTFDTNSTLATSWDVYVKDINNCFIKIPNVSVLADPLPGGITVTILSQCPSATGTYDFTVNVATGMGPYEYSIGSGFQSGSLFTVNASGTYNVTVKDKFGCTTIVNGLVNILPALTLQPIINILPTCADGDGKVTLVASGGANNAANYVYNIDGGPFVVGNVFSTVTGGAHTFGVKDTDASSTTCTKFVDVTLALAKPITGFTLGTTPVTCNGGTDGTITATMTTPAAGVNDNPVYKYTLSGITVTGTAINVGPQDSPLFSGLAAGNYTVDVVSGRGCPASLPKTVTQPNPIVVPAPTVTQYSCTAGNSGNLATISIDPLAISGGTAPYLNYEFIRNGTRVYFGPNNSYTEADLLGGNYVVKVYDSKGCLPGTSVSVPIAKYIALDKINVVINKAITCANAEDITVNVSAIGGIPNNLSIKVEDVLYDPNTGLPLLIHTYSVTKIVAVPTAAFTGLPVGSYLITVKNLDTNCEIQNVHYVNEPNTFDLTIDNIANVTCSNSTDGSAKVTFIDKVITATDLDQAGPFDYTLVDALGTVYPGGSSATATLPLTTLAAGTYTITATLKNTPFCSVSKSFTITGPTAALKASELHTEITCISGGSISASATGGWPGGYEYKLAGTVNVAYSVNSVFKNLTAGPYTLSVRDSSGCEDSISLTLNNPTAIGFTATPNILSLSCHGDTNARITVGLTTGGQGSNYRYTLNRTSLNPVISSAPQSGNIFTDLGAGTYTITVTDGWGCGTTSTPIVITEPGVIVASLVKASSQTCLVDARLTLSATGGTGLYSYSTTSDFAIITGTFVSSTTFPVPVGTYHYYVRDANGCTSVVSGDIANDLIPALNVGVDTVNSKINCKGDSTGVIIATATGGLGNYNYTLLSGAGLPLAFTPTQVTPGNFTKLPAGSYMVHVDSGLDCKQNSIKVDINEPPAKLDFTSSKTDVKCAGNGDGSITVNGFDGTGIINYAISPRSDKFLDSGVFNNLKPGTYTVIVQDENGCYISPIPTFTITEPLPISVKIDPLSIKQEYCSGDKTGEFSVIITDGTAPYSTSLDVANGTYVLGQVDFKGLRGGKHTVYVKDVNLCDFELVVALAPSVVLDPIATPTYDCVNDLPANKVTVTIDDSNDSADVLYSLDSSSTTQASNVFTNLVPGDHFIMAHHKNGCVDATSVFNVKQVDPVAVSIGLGGLNEIVATATGGSGVYRYTVNGEDIGSNYKYIYYKSGDYTVTVTDSNGCVAAVTKPFEFIDIIIPPIFTPTGDGTNDYWRPTNTENYPDIKFVVYDRYGRIVGTFGAGQFWDGKYNGTELPMGDYWYVLKLRNTKDDREFVGHFTLYR